MQSTRLQLVFYVALVGLFFIGCAILLFAPSGQLRQAYIQESWLLSFMCTVGILMGTCDDRFIRGFVGVLFLVILVRCASVQKLGCWFLSPKIFYDTRLFAGLILLLYCLIFLLWPLKWPLVCSNLGIWSFGFESHYAMTVLPGWDMSMQGTGLTPIARTNYGMGIPLLMALPLKTFPILGISSRNLPLCIKIFQIITISLISVILWQVNRKATLWGISIILLAVGFTLNNLSAAVLCPNQSGIRYVPLLLLLLIIAFQTRKKEISFWLLGTTTSLVILLNPETGVAALAGMIVLIVLKAYDPKVPFQSIFKALGQFALFFMISGGLWFVLLRNLYLSPPRNLFTFFNMFLKGYGGMVEKPQFVATLTFFFATKALLEGILAVRQNDRSWKSVYQASLGTIILVWMPYYINRMLFPNLWFQIVLLFLLMAPRWNQKVLKDQLRGSWAVSGSIIFLCFVGGQLMSSLPELRAQLKNARQVNEELKQGRFISLVNGIEIPLGEARAFQEQITVLPKNKKEVLVLSNTPTTIRLLGWNKGFPWYDVVMEQLSKQSTDTVVSWLDREGPHWIYANSLESFTGRANTDRCRILFESILSRLQKYRFMTQNTGWLIFERISSDSK
jgi:hypothetical protein